MCIYFPDLLPVCGCPDCRTCIDRELPLPLPVRLSPREARWRDLLACRHLVVVAIESPLHRLPMLGTEDAIRPAPAEGDAEPPNDTAGDQRDAGRDLLKDGGRRLIRHKRIEDGDDEKHGCNDPACGEPNILDNDGQFARSKLRLLAGDPATARSRDQEIMRGDVHDNRPHHERGDSNRLCVDLNILQEIPPSPETAEGSIDSTWPGSCP